MSAYYHVTNKGNTDFMEKCEELYGERSALTMLKTPEKCHLSHLNNNGDTPFMIACGNNKPKLALEMLKDLHMCNLDHINKKSQSALLIACINNKKAIVNKIIACFPTKCGKLSMIDKEEDRTIFMIMCEYGWYDIIQEMFNIEEKYKIKCNIGYKNKYNIWALNILIHQDDIHDHITPILTSAHHSTCGFNMLTTDSDNNTILMLACGLRDDTIALAIAYDYNMKHGISNTNKNGETALVLATKTGKERVVSAIVSSPDAGECIRKKDNNGMSAFLYAIQTQRTRIVDELLPFISREDLQDIQDRRTPLTRYDFSAMEKIKYRLRSM